MSDMDIQVPREESMEESGFDDLIQSDSGKMDPQNPVKPPVAKTPTRPLFFEDSSDEDEEQPAEEEASAKNETLTKMDVAITPPSATSASRKRQRTPIPAVKSDVIDLSDSPVSKRKASNMAVKPLVSATTSTSRTSDKPMAGPSVPRSTQASLLSSSPRLNEFSTGFIGEYYTTGYSLNQGKGYITERAPIIIERTKTQEERDQEKAKKAVSPAIHSGKPGMVKNGKLVRPQVKGGKQATLGSMGMGNKPAAKKAITPAKPTPVNNIIRFMNARKFVGRIPQKDAEFLSPLLDANLIHIDGYVLECPTILTTGCDITLCLQIHLTKQAFLETMSQDAKGKGRAEGGTFWQQQGETEHERKMRLRKDALGVLFERINLKPLRTSALVQKNKQNGKVVTDQDTIDYMSHGTQLEHYVKSRSQSPTKKSYQKSRNSSPNRMGRGKGKAKDEDGEFSEAESGDEAEVLNEEQLNELDNIYQRAQRNDESLDEMTPPDTFTYTLRPYQKQALHWMHALETGATNVRDQSMHPLWEEYAFKKSENEATTAQEPDVFYFNPYDGDLSVDFPRANTRARGGILADAMGMGKTCMLASLIHTNRQGEKAQPEEVIEAIELDDDDDDAPAAKRPKFRQITLSRQWRPMESKPASEKTETVPHATLVICPVSLAKQWQDELERMSVKGSLKTMLWYGNTRGDLDAPLGSDSETRVDVIITSYGTLTSEHAKWMKNKDKASYQGGGLFDFEWLRIVLDEAHTIKNRSSRGAKACYDLRAQRRWALSGTPIVNRLEDLYSLLHFLQLEPWGQYSFFRSFVTVPFTAQDPKALDVVQFILEQCLLRREKTMRDKDGKLIVDLPLKTITLEKLDFSRSERKIYDTIFERSKRKVVKMDQEGQMQASYTSILAMLMRLRQAVDHPLLVMNKTGDGDDDDTLIKGDDGPEENIQSLIAKFAQGKENDQGISPGFATQVLQNLGRRKTVSECMICTGEIEGEVVLPCYHTGCRDCIQAVIETAEDKGSSATCPACGTGPITLSSLKEVVRQKPKFGDTGHSGGGGGGGGETTMALRKVDFRTSTKLQALVSRLKVLEEQDPLFKALVFSQFTSMLSLIEPVLSDNGIEYLRFDGAMNQAQRASVVESFGKPSKRCKVLLISLKAGGVGLNLTMANHVFLMDCWWNEAIEQQAIDRVHRLGQTKPVFVTRFIIRKTIEKRILKIQKSKTALVNASLQGKTAGGGSMADIKAIFGLDDGEDSSDDDENNEDKKEEGKMEMGMGMGNQQAAEERLVQDEDDEEDDDDIQIL